MPTDGGTTWTQITNGLIANSARTLLLQEANTDTSSNMAGLTFHEVGLLNGDILSVAFQEFKSVILRLANV